MENKTFVNDYSYSNLTTWSGVTRSREYVKKKQAEAQAEYDMKMAKIKLEQAKSQSEVEKATAEYEQAKADKQKAKNEQTKAELEQKDLEAEAKKLDEANNPTPPPTPSGMSKTTKLIIVGALVVGAFFYFRKK